MDENLTNVIEKAIDDFRANRNYEKQDHDIDTYISLCVSRAGYKNVSTTTQAPVVPSELKRYRIEDDVAHVSSRGGWVRYEDLVFTLGHREEPGGCKCPECGSPEVDAMSPRTVYACGSSDYDARPGTFKKGDKCATPPLSNIVREAVEKLIGYAIELHGTEEELKGCPCGLEKVIADVRATLSAEVDHD